MMCWPPFNRLYPLYSAASEFWRVPASLPRKRMALRHALLKGSNAGTEHYDGKQPEVHDAAVAVATELLSAGEHMPCR
jgi:hypothetical protein